MDEQHDPFEDQLRNALRGEPSRQTDVDSFLDQVHRGARRRRTRRSVVGTAAAVCLVVGGGVAVAATGILDQDHTAPVAGDTSATTDGTAGTIASASPAETPEPESFFVQSGGPEPPPRVKASQIVALDVTATGTTHQWILGSVPGGDCGDKRCLRVFRTQNAGGSWADLAELPAHPVVGTEDSESVDGLRFAGDGTNGWAFGGAMLATHDSGRSWARQDVPVRGNVLQVDTWGEDALAVVYDGEGASLVRQDVGSDSWDVVPYAEQAGIDARLASVGDVAISEDAAIMTVYGSRGVTVLVSPDRGTTWEQPESSEYCEPGAQSASLVSVTADSLWVSCLDVTGSPETTVSVSSDLGATWDQAGGTFANGALIAGRDADEVVVVEGAGAYQVSATEVWLAQPPSETEPERIGTFGDSAAGMVEFTNPDTGYIVLAGGGLLRTNDGGRSWGPFGVTRLE
jgi:photosystem II stability/assembly factor-like uncharacterized protein